MTGMASFWVGMRMEESLHDAIISAFWLVLVSVFGGNLATATAHTILNFFYKMQRVVL